VAPLQIARGLQNKVLEAIAAGLPAVMTPEVAGGLPPAVTPACDVAADPAAFASRILALLRLTPTERRARAGSASLDGLRWNATLASLPAALASARNRP